MMRIPSIARSVSRLAFIAGVTLWQSHTFADATNCGSLTNHFGPFDYQASPPEKRALVDNAHFTPDVEYLRRGQSTAVIGADINYTLGVFPNHPRALLAMSNLALKEKVSKPMGSTYTVDCWFDRAIRFRAEDSTVRMLYGIYLMRTNRAQTAVAQLEKASELEGENANLNYNLGLAYFDLRDFEKSLSFAHKAYEQGFPLSGLKNKLLKAGKWRNPLPKPVSPVENEIQEGGGGPDVEGGKSVLPSSQ